MDHDIWLDTKPLPFQCIVCWFLLVSDIGVSRYIGRTGHIGSPIGNIGLDIVDSRIFFSPLEASKIAHTLLCLLDYLPNGRNVSLLGLSENHSSHFISQALPRRKEGG